MIKRPIDKSFREKVLAGKKRTTIRRKPWPLGVPIMLYSWTGEPYRSKHDNLVSVMCSSWEEITLKRDTDGSLRFHLLKNSSLEGRLFEAEGFDDHEALCEWFRSRWPQGAPDTQVLWLNFFRVIGE
jgi:hypothetical protein